MPATKFDIGDRAFLRDGQVVLDEAGLAELVAVLGPVLGDVSGSNVDSEAFRAFIKRMISYAVDQIQDYLDDHLHLVTPEADGESALLLQWKDDGELIVQRVHVQDFGDLSAGDNVLTMGGAS